MFVDNVDASRNAQAFSEGSIGNPLESHGMRVAGLIAARGASTPGASAMGTERDTTRTWTHQLQGMALADLGRLDEAVRGRDRATALGADPAESYHVPVLASLP